MRKYSLYLFLALLPLCGCLGLGVQFRDQQGRALDHPYGPEKIVVQTVFYQRYNGWTAVAIDGGSANTLAVGDSLTVKMTSRKHFSYEVFWDEQIGYDGALRKVRHSKVGLYTGQPIVIDEAFLRDVPFIEIVICNEGGEVTDYSDSQNHQFTLPPMGSMVLRVAAIEYRLVWRPSGNYSGESMRGCKLLTPGKKVFWNGKFYEDRIYTNRSRPNWRDMQAMRGNGCFPL